MNTQAGLLKHWYHEPWPWLLMAGPAIVIVAGAITTYLAVMTNDGLVADDYYKRGLAINQTLSRDALARQLGHHARITLAPGYGRVTVILSGGRTEQGPLVLRFAHAGRPSLDKVLPLVRDGDHAYVSAFPALSRGRWQVTLEDLPRTWRLVGDVVVPGRETIELAPR